MSHIIHKLYSAREMVIQDGWLNFIKSLGRYFFGFPAERYYLYEHTYQPRDRTSLLPRIPDFEDFFIHDIKEMNELEAKGFRFGARQHNMKIALENQAIIFCVFVDKKIIHTGRTALSEQAKPYVDNRPYKVNFNDKEACAGNTWTAPEFRGRGLMKYGYFRRFEYLHNLGIITVRNSVDISNNSSQQAHAYFEPRVYAKATYRRFLHLFNTWHEKPIEDYQ